MTSKHDSRSPHGHEERKGMRQTFKGIFGHGKNKVTPSDSVIATGHATKSEDLWQQAYGVLELREPDLMGAYNLLLTVGTNITDSSLSPETIETIVKSKLEDREANQLVINLGPKPVKVREQGEKVIRFILWSKDIVSQALSAQPYAALAWSGVSILLPLLLNSSQQSHTMIEGLSSVSDLLRLYRIKEMFYLRDAENTDKPVHLNFVQAVVELYSNIFEYQARMFCHLSQSSLKRGVRGTLELDDWEGMLKTIKTSSDTCDQYCVHLDRTRESKFFENESTNMLQSLNIQNRILETLETSQTSRQQDIQNDKEAELLRILASNYKSDKESVSPRVSGTCEWFFKDDRFLSWRDGKHSRLLWVSAGPGCGKSVLSRSLIDERKVTTNTLTSTVCYFFFKDGQEQRVSGANALSAILHHLLLENTALISHALPSARSYGTQLRENFSELWDILMRCAQDSEAGDIICVFDALDECAEKSRYELQEKLVSFSQKEAQKSPCKLKFLVTSRPYEDLEWRFKKLSSFSSYLRLDGDEKSRMIGEEINLVIDHEMPRIAEGFSVQHCERISKRLKEMDNRNYLWLFLTFGIITASRSSYSKMSSIDSLLSSLPSKISDAYEDILSKSSDEVRARVLLQLIMAATRPLSLEEINIALTIATEKAKYTSHKALDENLWPPQDFKSIVRNMCGLFISVHDGKVSLIHQTAREFLVQRNELHQSPSGKWQGYIDMATAHGIISQVCLDYLNLDELVGIPKEEAAAIYYYDEESNSKYHLLNYAAVNWLDHYTLQDEERASDSWKTVQDLCDPSLPQLSCWFRTHCFFHLVLPIKPLTSLGLTCFLGSKYISERLLDDGSDVNAEAAEENHGSTALQIASLCGHYEVVQMLLDKGASVNINGRVGNALYDASSEGHDRVVRLLLDRGADINAQGGVFGSALQIALYEGHIQVVRLLLDRGADVNARGGRFGSALQSALKRDVGIALFQIILDKAADINTDDGLFGYALQAAAFYGRDQEVQLLLDRGANSNAGGENYGNALQAASYSGHDRIVQLLLDRGADVNARGGDFGNAVQAASYSGHDRTVQLLLDRGADINARGGRFGNAVQAASYSGHDRIVQLLLDRGADINARGGDFGNAVRAASYSGHDRIVQLLLDGGADINARGGGFNNAVQAASYSGHDRTVQLLFDRGADLNAQELELALRSARHGGHNRIVQLLLDRGARSEAELELEDELIHSGDNTSSGSWETE